MTFSDPVVTNFMKTCRLVQQLLAAEARDTETHRVQHLMGLCFLSKTSQ